MRCARGSARHCSTPAAAAPHRTHHPPRLAFAAAAGRSDQPATQTHTQAPARAHASASQRTGPDRSNRWSKPTRPGHQRLSFCPNATAASRGGCLSLLPTKRPHQTHLLPSPLLSSPSSAHKNIWVLPPPTATAAASSPFPPAFALPPFRAPPLLLRLGFPPPAAAAAVARSEADAARSSHGAAVPGPV